ncbi:MAG: DNA polymerase IV, partial [Leifsonia sp.]
VGRATDRTSTILAVAQALLAASLPEIAERGITLIGLSLSHLGAVDDIQPELPIEWGDGEQLDTVLDALHDKFGAVSVTRGSQLGRDPGWSTPLLEEHQ